VAQKAVSGYNVIPQLVQKVLTDSPCSKSSFHGLLQKQPSQHKTGHKQAGHNQQPQAKSGEGDLETASNDPRHRDTVPT
jgi:hypothetical protein